MVIEYGGEIIMDQLLDILEELKPEVDFENSEDLIDGHKLDSLTILSLISEIEDEFDITFTMGEVQGFSNVGELIDSVMAHVS